MWTYLGTFALGLASMRASISTVLPSPISSARMPPRGGAEAGGRSLRRFGNLNS